jgi:hypothetical protein
MTVKVHAAESHQPRTALPREATPPAAPQVRAEGGAEVYWGDWVALKVWVFCFLLMWMMNILDLIAGIWRR